MRKDVQKVLARYRGAPSASRAAEFRKVVQRVSNPSTARQVDQLLGSAAYQAAIQHNAGLAAALTKLQAAVQQRNQLGCKQDAKLAPPATARELIDRAKAACTPTSKAANLIASMKQQRSTANGVAKLDAALARQNKQQLGDAVGALALDSSSAQALMQLANKLTTENPDDGKASERARLELELAKALQMYDANLQLCGQGQKPACDKLPGLTATIAELTAQLQALD